MQEGSDAATIREFLLDRDPDEVTHFMQTLEEAGYDMRKSYLFDEESKPVLPAETIKEMQAQLSRQDFDLRV